MFSLFHAVVYSGNTCQALENSFLSLASPISKTEQIYVGAWVSEKLLKKFLLELIILEKNKDNALKQFHSEAIPGNQLFLPLCL